MTVTLMLPPAPPPRYPAAPGPVVPWLAAVFRWVDAHPGPPR